MARGTGSYPVCRGFDSNFRYHQTRPNKVSFDIYGPLVKRLRHRPFTAVTRVRFSYGSPHKKGVHMDSFFVSCAPHTETTKAAQSHYNTHFSQNIGSALRVQYSRSSPKAIFSAGKTRYKSGCETKSNSERVRPAAAQSLRTQIWSERQPNNGCLHSRYSATPKSKRTSFVEESLVVFKF